MKHLHFGLCLFMIFSASVSAEVVIEEKQNRVKFIENLGAVAPSISVEAYRRELEYEKQNLPLEERAKNEASLLAQRIQEQIAAVYEMSLKEHGNEARAASEIKESIEKDLELAAPEFKEELKRLAFKTLDQIQNGGLFNTTNLSNLEQSLRPSIQKRSEFLNEETGKEEKINEEINKFEYASEQELVESLISRQESARWVSTAYQTITSDTTVSTDSTINVQLKIEFLGVSVDAGPQIAFKREYSTQVAVMAEDLSSILLENGMFDKAKRDLEGNLIKKNGVPQRRFINFTCEASLRFASDYKGAGGFKIAGIGGERSFTENYSNSVRLQSRRVLVPDYVAGKTVTMSQLSRICHTQFLKAKINSGLTIAQNLNAMMKSLISGLTFSHPKNKCVRDSDCAQWYNTKVGLIWKYRTMPRCVEQESERYRACEIRGTRGQACKVYKNGKLISAGLWEIECDKGLSCAQVEEESWFNPARGECHPNF